MPTQDSVASRLRTWPKVRVALVALLSGAVVAAALLAVRPRPTAGRVTVVATSNVGTFPENIFLDPPLPMESLPPNPCDLLTTAEVIAGVGGHVDGVLGPSSATSLSPVRRCDWSVVWGPNDSGEVTITTMTAAANTAARAALVQAGRDPTSTVPTLSVVFAEGHFTGACECSPIANASVLGYPARFGGVGSISVLTPTALVAVTVGASAHDFGVLHIKDYVIHEEATAANFAKQALGRLNSICPCGHESPPTGPPPGILPAVSQPPDPCHLLTADEVTSTIGGTVNDPGTAALADSSNGMRTCGWAVENSWSGGAALSIMTTASQAAARTARARAQLGPGTIASSLHDVFARDLLLGPFPGHAPFEDLTVLGHPAQYVSGVAWLQVLAPSALVTVSAAGSGVPKDEATLVTLAKLALARIGSTGS
jgi:hypothetical protein